VNLRNSWAMMMLGCLFVLGQQSSVSAQTHGDSVFPSCGVPDVKDGNPGTGPSVVRIKFQPGCVIPWHWHTPNERVMVISGSAKAEMKGMEPVMLKEGDFILLSAKHIHQFTAVTSTEIFVVSEAAFDIHYVDATGKEIPAQDALAPKVSSSAAKP
jgi:quercetin dioxygenase-like cupin family protein